MFIEISLLILARYLTLYTGKCRKPWPVLVKQVDTPMTL